MRILITGASGFIGARLTAALLAADPATRIVAVDIAPPRGEFIDEPRVEAIVGDASGAALLASLLRSPVDSIFALGATLTSDAEARFDRGYDVNLQGMIRLLDACRTQARPPRLVFASSIAAFGGPLPATVDDGLQLTPQTSYGTQKAIVELLVNDHSRHGHVDGRCLRLPIVIVRPGEPVASVSDRLAGIVREPLRGRDAVCPWRPDTTVTVASVQAAVRALMRLHDVPAPAFGHTRSVNLPAIGVRIDAIVAAVERVARRRGIEPIGRVAWTPDAAMQAVVDGWPRHFVSSRAAAFGIEGDASIDAVIERYLDDPG